MSKEVEVVWVGMVDGRVALTLVDEVYLITPQAARIYACLMAHVADWIDPVVAEPLEDRD